MPRLKDLVCVCGYPIKAFFQASMMYQMSTDDTTDDEEIKELWEIYTDSFIKYTTDDGKIEELWEFDTEGRALVCAQCGRMYLCCEICSDLEKIHKFNPYTQMTEKYDEIEQNANANANVILCQFLGCLDTRIRSDETLKYSEGDIITDCDNFFPSVGPDYYKYIDKYIDKCDILSTSDIDEICPGIGYINHTARNVNWVRNEEIEKITGEKICGPDGGAPAFWKCQQCNKLQISRDK